MKQREPQPMWCPVCLNELRQAPDTGYPEYGWCATCQVWKKGER